MDTRTIRICFSFLLFSFVIEANTNETITVDELRQPRVSGRIVKLYSGTRPEPVYCQHEGFQADPANCAVFYRCVKGASNKFTVFRFQCGPGTVYDPDTEVCNFPRSTKRSECGGTSISSTEKSIENEIEGVQSEVPSPISTSKPIYGEALRDTTIHSTAYPWASSNPQYTQTSSSATTAYPWMTTNANKGSPAKKPTSPVHPSRQEGDACTTDGFMGDSENCRKFYRCVGNQRGSFIRYEFMCSESTIWDDDAQSCNHPWAVQRRRCGRGSSDGDTQPTTSNQQNNKIPSNTTIQEQLQINYGDKVTQTQTQISHGQVIQNQTQINYGDQSNKPQNSQVKQNQTQISHGSAVSQTQTQINHGGNAVQTQLQVDHTKDSSQSQTQVHETTSRTTTTSNTAQEPDQSYGDHEHDTQDSEETNTNTNQCTETGFMGDSNNCKKFYRCVDNGRGGFTKYEFTCGEGTVWDSSIEACNHAWAVKKCGGKVPQSSPEDSSQSTATTTTITTTTAKTTQNYQPTSQSMTDEDYDNGYGNQNQQPDTTSSSSTSKPSSTTSTSDSSSNSTECQSSGFMGDPKDCTKFYRCVDNGKGGYTKYEYKCGEGTVWDPEIDACNHPWAVQKCGGSSTDVNKEETITSAGTTQAITTVSLVQTTTQASSGNGDYDSGYGQQQSESSSSSTSTTKQPQASGSNEGNKCQSSGFMGDENDCKRFYRCVDNGNGAYTRYEFTCGEGTVWDSQIEACNHPWAVEKCGGNDTGDINKETTPGSSQTMSDEETGTTGVPGKETDKPTQSPATSAQTTEQPKPTKKPATGNECSQEGFIGDNNDCKTFYRCVDNGRGGFIKYEFSCGDGTIWDSEINTCNHENSVKSPCSSGTSTQNENVTESSQESTSEQAVQTTSSPSTDESKTTEKTSTTIKPSTGKECQQEGFMGDENDCKKFYRCVDNGRGGYIKYEFSCGEGTVWDPELNTCNHPSANNRCGGTGNQSSSTEPNSENDEPITDATSGTTQSSTEQSQTTTAAQKPQPSNDTCTSEGFFGDSKDCKKFYRCVDNDKGGYTKYDFTCGDGTVWDQEIQACNHETGNANCSKSSSSDTQTSRPQTESTNDGSSATSSSTEGQQSTERTESPPAEFSGNCTSEGFYANPNDCKKFYRCVSNDKGGYTKYEFSCGEGTMWVQEIQACDHDTGETSCSSQSAPASSTTESTGQQSSTTVSSITSSGTATQKPAEEDDEYPGDSSSQPPSSSSEEKCTSEGFYPNKNNCRQFYRCVDNGNGGYTKYDFTCGEGTAWDSEVQTCNHISEVKSCQSSGQGESQSQTMQDEETSQSSGSSTTESTTKSSTSGSTTESSKPSQDTCEQEGYFGNTQYCTKFYRCVDNGKGGLTKYDFSCGEGTIWDQDVLTCNHPQDVSNPSCKQSDNNQSSDSSSSSTISSSSTTSSSSSSSSGTTSSTTESSSSSDCSQSSTKKPANKNVNCTKAGYYPDPNDCKKFYRCVDWDGDGKRFSVYHFDCGEGTIWDPALDTCNHEDSVYPPRDCSGGSQSQSENVDQESTTTTTEGTTTEEVTKTTEQTTTQESTASEQTTQESSNEQTTTEQTTTSEQTTEQSTTQQTSEEHSTTEQTTSEHTTTQQSTTEHTTEHESTTKESTTEHSNNEQSTTQESSNTEETTTHESTTEQSTTEQSTTEQSTTEQSTTEQSTTEESITEHSTTEQSTTEQSTTEQSTTEQSTTEQSTTEQSTTEQIDSGGTTESEHESTTESETESSTENGEQTTESSSSSNKDCPETDDDQNLFVCPTSFRRHPKYCNMFYQCTEDDDTHDVQIATFRCPNNTIYDESKTKCVEEGKADKKCDGEIAQKRRVKRLDATYKEPIVVTNERLKCPAAGHYPFEKEECSPAFLKCQKTKSGKIRGYVYQCPPNHVYWSVSRRCEPKGHLKDCKRSYNNWNGRWEIPVERRNVAP